MATVEQFLKNTKNNNISISKFLTEEEQVFFRNINNKIIFPDICERKRIIVYNNNYKEELEHFFISDYISIIKIDYNKRFGNITHRDILGSLIGLGLKRECIGDIIVDDIIYVFVIKEMEQFIVNNLYTIGKVNVNVEICDFDCLNNININNYVEDKIIVSSYRLDNIISERCNLSREKAKQYISLKNVKINGVINVNPDYIVKIDDLISIHRYGRLIIKEELNKTKKEKYVLRVFKTK